jgi:tRNA A37 threonylcarbamoyladenosine dehydratase
MLGDGSLNCHGYGSVVTVTATFGLVAAGQLLDAMARFQENFAPNREKQNMTL